MNEFNPIRWGQSTNLAHAELRGVGDGSGLFKDVLYERTKELYHILNENEERFKKELEDAKISAEQHIFALAQAEAERQIEEEQAHLQAMADAVNQYDLEPDAAMIPEEIVPDEEASQ